MKIAHLADIHIRGISRHKEYRESFEETFEILRAEQPDIIFLGGDIWHTKTQGITPEGIELLVWLFDGLAQIAPLHMILGNHDANLTNSDRQDVISPILTAMNNKDIQLYKKSGIYPLADKVNLCVFSCTDEEGWKEVSPVPGDLNIAAFHGSVLGCKYENEWASPHGDVSMEFFNGYDFALLGDIHKMQSLAMRKNSNHKQVPWIAYPGSLIQQNYAEAVKKGFLIWDIKTRDDFDVKFHALENRYPFVTIDWKGNVQDTLAQVEVINPGSRFRILAKESISQLEVTHLHNELKTVHGVEEVRIKFDLKAHNTDVLSTGDDGVEITKSNIRNDIDGIMKLFTEFKDNNKDSLEAYSELSDEEDVKPLIDSYLQRYNAQENEAESTLRNVYWKLKTMKFDNVFRYNEGNIINFENLSGVVGLFANNRMGKSSIVGTMMYGLYNSTDRGPMKNAHVVNRQKKNCKVSIDFSVAGGDYRIERQTVKQTPGGKRSKAAMQKAALEEDKSVTHLNLFKLEPSTDPEKPSEYLELNGEQRGDTEKEIRKLIGTADDFMMTALSSQGGLNRFIQEGSTARRQILSRFLELDIFEKLHSYAKEDCQILNAKLKKYSQFDWQTVLTTKRTSKIDFETEIEGLEVDLNAFRKEVEELKIAFAIISRNTHSIVTEEQLSRQKRTVGRISQEMESTQENIAKVEEFINKQSLILENFRKIKQDKPIEEYKKRLASQQKLQMVLVTLKHQYESELTTLNGQEKTVYKLTLVPCGDSFPSCRYISDAHRDKNLLPGQKEKIEKILAELNTARQEFDVVKQDNLEEKIQKYEALLHRETVLEGEISTKKNDLSHLGRNVENLQKDLEREQLVYNELEARYNGTSDDLEVQEGRKLSESLADYQIKINELDKRRLLAAHKVGVLTTEIENIEQEQEEYKTLLKQLRLYELILTAFSKTGIPAMILKSQLPAINAELEKILSGIVDFKVILDADASSNNMDVYIEDPNSKRIIELASGMEKTMSSLALRAALLNLSTLPKPDIFIIDEGFEGLDAFSLPKCVELIQSLKTHFKTILLISHLDQVKESVDTILDIQSSETESHIEII